MIWMVANNVRITMHSCFESSPGPTKLSAGSCSPISFGLEAVTLIDTATDQPEMLIRTEPAVPYMRIRRSL